MPLNPKQQQRRQIQKQHRRELRETMTPAEAALWTLLRKRQLEGRRFRRQHSIGPFIVDFFCPEEKLAIELDGAVHDDPGREEYDDARTVSLEAHGIRVVRFENREVFDDPEAVLEAIAMHFGQEDHGVGSINDEC